MKFLGADITWKVLAIAIVLSIVHFSLHSLFMVYTQVSPMDAVKYVGIGLFIAILFVLGWAYKE